MDPRPAPGLTLRAARGRRREAGFTTTQYVTAVGMSLVVFVMLANLVVDRYEQGVLRAAVDEAARAGADVDAGASACEARGRAVLAALLSRSQAARLSCRVVGRRVRATVSARLASWLPLVPDWKVTVSGSAPRETAP